MPDNVSPVTHLENVIAGEVEPKTHLEKVINEYGTGGGGVDPESITLITLNVNQNGTTNAPSGKAYNKVVANVPNTYGASDEGKVVSSGALVNQTNETVTENGTVDTTTIKQVTVNVPQGSTPTGTKNSSISQNGTTTENVAGYASAAITVAVPVPTLTALSATDNGTYTAPSGTAYNSVVVAIPTATGVSF